MKLYLIAPRSDGCTEYAALSGDQDERVTRFASAAIATVAALAPPSFECRLCDEENEDIDFEADCDLVGITANVSQAHRALEIADQFRKSGRIVVFGGPHVSLAPEMFAPHADSLVVGELESVAEAFFDDMAAGCLKDRYDGARISLSSSPQPRWDLYANHKAVSGVVQTSRGCPFECNFCDVIQYLGRVQRHKPVSQVISELQTLYDLGYNNIILADDNFTVYRKRARELLAAIATWNGADGREYVGLATQMSIDVAREEDLLQLCNQAGVLQAFVGIETSDPVALTTSGKRQNLKIDLVEQCRRITRAGLLITGGLMVGFDSDDKGVFERQFDFAMRLPVPTFSLSVLVAPVATPLYDQMLAEGRIVSDQLEGQFPAGNLVTNIRPSQMTREELAVGARWLINKLYDPDNFFKRFEHAASLMAPPPWVGTAARSGRRPPDRPAAAALFARVVRTASQDDPRIATLIRRCRRIMRERRELRDGLSEALAHYLMTRKSYQLAGAIAPAYDGPSPFPATRSRLLKQVS